MGEVYRARDLRLGRDVAIKVLPSAFAEDAPRLRRFEQEARTLGALSHPNVLAVFDVGTFEGRPYLVMELLEGETLRDRLLKGAIPVKRALELALQTAHGLTAAHAIDLVHRDLKPANLFLTQGGHLKILDFGLAKQAVPHPELMSQQPTRDMHSLTAEGFALGTVGYMSPEQVEGRPVDARSDIFAFGVVLYEMISGRRAFERGCAIETMSATLREEPPELDSPFGPIPPALKGLVAHCLEKEPGHRYRSAQELEGDLEDLLAGAVFLGRRPWAVLSRGMRRRRLPLVAALLLGSVAAGLALWKPWRGRAPAMHVPTVVALPAKVLGSQESAFLTDAIPETLSTLLANVEGLETRVSPTSFQLERVKGDLGKVAEAYRVGHLVLSSVTAQGENLILNVQLVEATNQKVVWAAQIPGTRGTYTSMLQEAALGLRRALKPSASGKGGEPAFRSEVELALREGRYFQKQYSRSRDAKAFERSLAALQRAQAFEPTSALLAAEIANIFQVHYFAQRDTRSKEESERWVAHALALDPRCGRAWAVRCWLETNRTKVDPGLVVECALKAARFSPDDANSFIVLGSVGPTCAFQAANGLRALELDPLNTLGYSWAAMCYSQLGRKEEALALLERANRVATRPGFHSWLKYYCLFHAGRLGEAKEAYTEVQWAPVSKLMGFLTSGDLEGGKTFARGLAAGWRKEELGSMDLVNYTGFFGPLLVRLGMREEALWLMDRSADTDFPPSPDFLLADPDLQQLKGDPRFTKAVAAGRKYAVLFSAKSEAAKARGEFPPQLDPALVELREFLGRNR